MNKTFKLVLLLGAVTLTGLRTVNAQMPTGTAHKIAYLNNGIPTFCGPQQDILDWMNRNSGDSVFFTEVKLNYANALLDFAAIDIYTGMKLGYSLPMEVKQNGEMWLLDDYNEVPALGSYCADMCCHCYAQRSGGQLVGCWACWCLNPSEGTEEHVMCPVYTYNMYNWGAWKLVNFNRW